MGDSVRLGGRKWEYALLSEHANALVLLQYILCTKRAKIPLIYIGLKFAWNYLSLYNRANKISDKHGL